MSNHITLSSPLLRKTTITNLMCIISVCFFNFLYIYHVYVCYMHFYASIFLKLNKYYRFYVLILFFSFIFNLMYLCPIRVDLV